MANPEQASVLGVQAMRRQCGPSIIAAANGTQTRAAGSSA
jgi:hypothetical protein